jgi:hypothetical protein
MLRNPGRELGETRVLSHPCRREPLIARGTGSLRNGDRSPVIQPTQRKVVFSGAIAQPNEAPHAGYFDVLSG